MQHPSLALAHALSTDVDCIWPIDPVVHSRVKLKFILESSACAQGVSGKLQEA